jgi:methyl-accepting chemotaxis protein
MKIFSKNIIIIVSAVVFTLVLFISVLFYNAHIQKYDGVRINLAGRERMLTQKISKEVLLFKFGKISEEKIKKDIEVFEITLKALIEGGDAPTDLNMISFRKLPRLKNNKISFRLKNIEKKWQTIHSDIDMYLKEKNEKLLDKITLNCEKILPLINAIVFDLQYEAERKNRIAHILAYISLISVFLTLLFFMFFVILKKEKTILETQQTLKNYELILSICSNCKKIKSLGPSEDSYDEKSWIPFETYFQKQDQLGFSHGICPDCMKELYPEIYKKMLNARIDQQQGGNNV